MKDRTMICPKTNNANPLTIVNAALISPRALRRLRQIFRRLQVRSGRTGRARLPARYTDSGRRDELRKRLLRERESPPKPLHLFARYSHLLVIVTSCVNKNSINNIL